MAQDLDESVDVYMPIFIGDYLRDTSDLSAEEHGAYFKLMMQLWVCRGYLPADPDRLARIGAVERERWPAVWSTISRFFDTFEGKISQKRLLHELEVAREKRRRASEKGRKGAAARHGTGSSTGTATGIAPALPVVKLEAQPEAWLAASSSPSPSEGRDPTPPRAPARDPGTPEPKPGQCTGYDLMRWYGEERAKAVAGALAWTTPRSTDGKASSFAAAIRPEDVRDVRTTMAIHFAELVAGRGKTGALENPTFGFACWMSEFTALLERHRGVKATPRQLEADSPSDIPCDFHRRGQNTGRRAPKEDFRKTCAECRHLQARAGPKREAEPTTAADLLREVTHGT